MGSLGCTSTLLRKAPLIGEALGYMPTRETMDWDLEAGEMRLAIETLPFLPTIDVKGTGLAFDAETATFSYQITKTETGPDGEQVEVKKPESTWRVLYADDALFAADSSKTGLCLVKRL